MSTEKTPFGNKENHSLHLVSIAGGFSHRTPTGSTRVAPTHIKKHSVLSSATKVLQFQSTIIGEGVGMFVEGLVTK